MTENKSTIESTESTESTIQESPTKTTKPTKSKVATKPKTTASTKASPKAVTTPKKPRQKKLTLKSIQEQEAKINEWSTYVLDSENNTVIKYYKIFDEAKIQMLLTEAYEKMEYAKLNEIEFFVQDEDLYLFINYLNIKHFTHLGEELENSSLEDDIAAISTLISTGLFKTILNDVFDGNEVTKVLEVMHEHIEMSARAIEMENQMKQDTLKAVQSPVIKNKLEANSTHRNVLN